MRALILAAAMCCASLAMAHDIYNGLRMKDGTLPCCGGSDAGAARDCWRTIYRERGGDFEFRSGRAIGFMFRLIEFSSRLFLAIKSKKAKRMRRIFAIATTRKRSRITTNTTIRIVC